MADDSWTSQSYVIFESYKKPSIFRRLDFTTDRIASCLTIWNVATYVANIASVLKVGKFWKGSYVLHN